MAILMFAAVCVPTLAQFGIPPLVGAALSVGILFFLSKLPRPSFMGFVHIAGIEVEIWQDHIEGNLFAGNEFMLKAIDASQYVTQGKTVRIPQAGGLPDIEKNRTSVPATVTTRTDTTVEYDIDGYSSAPILLRTAESLQLSYSKRESVLYEHEAALRTRIAEEIMRIWAPSAAANILRTTGATTATHLSDTTGDRKLFVPGDLKRAQFTMNKMNMPMEERYALMSSDMLSQLLDSLTVTQERDFSSYYDAKNGVLGKLYGFLIMERSSTLSYTNAATPVVNAYGADVNEDDNDGILCWQRAAVEMAKGEVKFFEKLADPQFYGDVYSFEVFMGGRKRRNDQKGIVAIVQDAAN